MTIFIVHTWVCLLLCVKRFFEYTSLYDKHSLIYFTEGIRGLLCIPRVDYRILILGVSCNGCHVYQFPCDFCLYETKNTFQKFPRSRPHLHVVRISTFRFGEKLTFFRANTFLSLSTHDIVAVVLAPEKYQPQVLKNGDLENSETKVLSPDIYQRQYDDLLYCFCFYLYNLYQRCFGQVISIQIINYSVILGS